MDESANGYVGSPCSSGSSEADPYDPSQDPNDDDPFLGSNGMQFDVSESLAQTVAGPGFPNDSAAGQDEGSDNFLQQALANLLLKVHACDGEKDASLFADLGDLLAVFCHEGHAEGAEKLLLAGAPVDHRTSAGATPLHLCCQAGHADTCQLLLRHSADVNLLMDPGMAALYIAAVNGKADCVKLLLEAKASLQTSANDECNPLHAACQEGHSDVVELLLAAADGASDGGSAWLQGPGGRNALVCACENGWPAIVRTLLAAGWGLDGAVSSSGYPPLYIAAMNGNLELVELLIEHKANVNEVCCDQSHALLAAAQNLGSAPFPVSLLSFRPFLTSPSDSVTPPAHS
eukprot:EG_transcript_16424